MKRGPHRHTAERRRRSSLRLGSKRLDLLLHTLLLLRLGELLVLVLLALLLPLLLRLLLFLILVLIILLLPWVLTDSLVRLLVELLEPIRLDLIVDVALELALVALLVVICQSLHVLRYVTAEDVLAKGLRIQLLALHVVAWEALLGVWDVEAAIRGSLQGAEDTGTGAGPSKTHIEEALEWATLFTLVLGRLGHGELAIWLLDTLEGLVELEFVEGAAGDQETGAVCGSPVGEAMLDAVAPELMGVRGYENLVAGELRGDDLADDVLVGEANDEAVLWCVVLVLGLGDELLAGEVVGLTRSATLLLHLVAAVCNVSSRFEYMGSEIVLPEVGTVLDQLGLYEILESAICASDPIPKHLAATLHHPAGVQNLSEALDRGAILTKGILTVLARCQGGWW